MSDPLACTDARVLEEAVREAYSAAALNPKDGHPFPVGRKYAESIGYPAQLLDTLPESAVAAFAGVANLPLIAPVKNGIRALDLGCGAGLDGLIAACRAGPEALVVGVDFSDAMLARAARSAAAAGVSNLAFCLANGGAMPFREGAFDLALANGIFNLNPARDRLFHELARVVHPGGLVYAAELVKKEGVTSVAETDIRNWFA